MTNKSSKQSKSSTEDKKSSRRSKKEEPVEESEPEVVEETKSESESEAEVAEQTPKKKAPAKKAAKKVSVAKPETKGKKKKKAKRSNQRWDTTTHDTCQNLIHDIEVIVSDVKKNYIDLRNNLRKLKSAYDSAAKKMDKKRKRSNNPTGFKTKYPVPEAFAAYLGIPKGTELTSPEITKKVWAVLKDRNLQVEGNRRTFTVDKETSKIFNVPMSVNDLVAGKDSHTNKDGFNFSTLQSRINYAMGRKPKVVAEAVVEEKPAKKTSRKS